MTSDPIELAKEALRTAEATITTASRILTEDHKFALKGKRWGESTLTQVSSALAALEADGWRGMEEREEAIGKAAEDRIAKAVEALREIKRTCLTYGDGPKALAHVVRLTIDAGITEKLDELDARAVLTQIREG